MGHPLVSNLTIIDPLPGTRVGDTATEHTPVGATVRCDGTEWVHRWTKDSPCINSVVVALPEEAGE